MTRVLLLWTAPTSTNLGVRALGEGSAALVRKVVPDAEVLSQSYGQGEAPVNIGVGRSLAREFVLNSRGLKSWIREFDLVLDTRAGDSFADIYGLTRLKAICQMAEFVKACGVPLVLGPQTIGPFDTRRGRLLGSLSLRRASLVMARDSVSADVAKRLGRTPDVLTTDVVFAMDQPEADEPRDVLLNVSGLLWTSNDHGSADKYQRAVRSLIAGLQERGRTVSLLSHVLDSPVQDNDEPTARALQEEFGLEHIVPRDLTHLRSIAKGASLVIGSRMHACLNALSVGTPAIPLAYSRKFRPLLADLGWRHVVDLSSSAQPAEDALAILDANPELGDEVAQVRTVADGLLDGAVTALRRLM
ncbi:MAG: polysaccharide pyruvyl transferase family protein [Arachnia sp.]